MYKKTITAIILVAATLTATAQSLTKQQMQEDYDQLYTTLTTRVPHFAVRKRVTGIDIPKELRRIRKDIDTVTCDGGFYDVIFRALAACNDKHISPNQTRDSVAMAHTKDAHRNHFRYGNANAKGVFYIDGRYLTLGFKDKEKEVIPFFAELTHVNGIPVDKYVAKYNSRVNSANRWDFKHKKAWASNLFDPRIIYKTDKFTWTVVIDGKSQTFDMTGLAYNIPRVKSDNGAYKVNYFERDSTLYIRIPEMNLRQAEWLEDQIASHKGKPVNRVIIDVRGNGGGNDMTWRRVLSAIIDRPLHWSLRQAVKDLSVLSGEYADPHEIKVYGDRLTAFLDEDSETTLQPSDRTIGYGGNIYIMFDHNIFSSTYALLSACLSSDRLVSVGRPSGFLGGLGGTPWGDILRHSRFSYRYPITLEITDADAANPETYYKDQVEIEVWPTIEQLRTQTFYDGGQHTEDFLYNHDWVFRKILEESKKYKNENI